jgi:hypothetical protein
LRLSFSPPPTTRRVTVEVFDTASTHCCLPVISHGLPKSRSHCDWRSVSQSALVSSPNLGLMTSMRRCVSVYLNVKSFCRYFVWLYTLWFPVSMACLAVISLSPLHQNSILLRLCSRLLTWNHLTWSGTRWSALMLNRGY